MKRKRMIKTVAAAALGAFSVGATAAEVVIGGKNFTEQLLLASITNQYLQAHGHETDKRDGMGSAVLRQAQVNGQVDLYWEYVGTSLIVYNDVEEQMSSEEAYETVKELDAEQGLVWLEPSNANNTYALAMRSEEAEEMGISTLSDLAAAINEGDELTFAVNAEFYSRSDGFRPLQETYEFEVPRPQVKRMDTGLTYQALKEDQVEVALVFATDGRIPAFDFRVLEDDKGFFPSYALTPVIRQEKLDEAPELADLMNELSSKLDDETMARLNAQVDVEGVSIENVAEEFLEENDLL